MDLGAGFPGEAFTSKVPPPAVTGASPSRRPPRRDLQLPRLFSKQKLPKIYNFPRSSLSARSNLISLCIVAVPGAGKRPLPGRAPARSPEPSGTYVVAEGKGPSEEWFITRDWKSVRLKTSSHPAAIFLIEDQSPFPKSARRQ